MAGRVEGQVAIVTGAARGQGRAHALKLASEGATVVLLDVPGPISTMPYSTSSAEDLQSSVREVQAISAESYGVEVDVRDCDGIRRAVDEAAERLGRIDILVANAGIVSYVDILEMSDDAWQEVIDVNLTGTFHCAQAAVRHMIERERGAIVITSSGLGRQGQSQLAHYVASKWAVLGFAKSLAREVGSKNIRVNALMPTTVNTPMIHHEAMYKLFAPEVEHPTADDMAPVLSSLNAMGVPWVEPEDIANAMMFLVSDDGRYVSGGGLDIGAGWTAQYSS